jgi:hypothetical protein
MVLKIIKTSIDWIYKRMGLIAWLDYNQGMRITLTRS